MKEYIVFQSAGSFSVAVVLMLITAIQLSVHFRRPQYRWYGWSAAISFTGMLYAIGIFIEYNAYPGALNHFGGVLEFAAIILCIHCMYGFTFSYLGMDVKWYHVPAGIFHAFVIILLFFTHLIVTDGFVSRSFLWMKDPFIESGLGPLGFFFEAYGFIAAFGVVFLWIRDRGREIRDRRVFLAGLSLWLLLCIHDGLATAGLRTVQYVMEYGFLLFSLMVRYVVLKRYDDISVEDKYRVITEYANDAIIVMQDGKTIFGNPASGVLLGRPASGMSVTDFLDLVVPEDKQVLIAHYRDMMESQSHTDTFMVRIRKTDGKEAVIEVNEGIIVMKERPAILAVMRDVTERKRKEEELRESEERVARLKKMESLGLLAGGVAHDLNNVLSGIVSYPELILMELPEDSRLRRPVEIMQDSGKRAVAIVQDLLTVARGVAVPKESLNLNRIVEGYLTSPEFKRLIQHHSGVKVKEALDGALLNIKGSAIHIRKAVMNLVSNASEAIRDSGQVIISTVNRYVERPLKGYDDVRAGEYAVLIVEDNGPGITSEDLKRIFEPFFTKKVMGRSGTGLGLTLVWNVMQDHEGYIDVNSSAKGTRFELYFPITREDVREKRDSVPIEALHGNGEEILVIDDIESQREISCSMLRKLGYSAMAVSRGEEAVECLKEKPADLLLLDMIMEPGIDGCETYRRIKEIRPGQKAVIVSGFAETERVKETLRMGAGRFLRKPLILAELGPAIKEVLAAHVKQG